MIPGPPKAKGIDAKAIAKVWAYLTPAERMEIEKLLSRDTRVWRPLPGPQIEALFSEADIVGFGGQAGGGKSDLICGLALTEHSRALIIRREKAQTRRFAQRIAELLGTNKGFNSQMGQFVLPGGGLVEFGGLDNPDDHERWRGIDHDLKAFDEVTDLRESQFRFIIGWARSAKAGQRVRILMTFNPPSTVEGRWIIKFFAPWIDDKHPRPALPGELRWFTTVGDDPDTEVPDARPFVIRDDGTWDYDFDPDVEDVKDVRHPLSRTFIPASVTQNPYLMRDKQYMAQLQSTPEPLRSQMLYGDFKAGIEDDAMQVIPTAWIDAAMDRWSNDPRSQGLKGKGPMDSMGIDPAAGGKDNFVIARRHKAWFDDNIRIPGREVGTDGAIGAGRVLAVRRDGAPMHVDVIGWGSAVHTSLVGNGLQSVPVIASNKSLEKSLEGNLPFANKRAEMVWRMRETLRPDAPEPAMIPDDVMVRADLAAYRWKYTSQGILIGSKDEMKVVLGRSPDDGDAICLANMATVPTETLLSLTRHAVGDYDRNSELREQYQ